MIEISGVVDIHLCPHNSYHILLTLMGAMELVLHTSLGALNKLSSGFYRQTA